MDHCGQRRALLSAIERPPAKLPSLRLASKAKLHRGLQLGAAMRLLKTVGLVIALALGGCASGYSKFYTPVTAPGFNPQRYEGEPEIIRSSGDFGADTATLFARGLGPVGRAAFNGPMGTPGQVIVQAKKVGAAVVVVSSAYTGSVQGAIPITTPTTSTSYSQGTATAFGPAGMATGTYNGTTTTYGTETTYVPYAIQRYDQAAVFFAPLPQEGMGVAFGALSQAQQTALGSAAGLAVRGVRQGSPAFLGGVISGDVLISVNGQPVYNRETLRSAVASAPTVKVELLRGDSRLEKTLSLPAGWSW